MSGLEVVGVVLGTLPLAIKALQAYKDVFSSVKNGKRDLVCLVRILETEQLLLQNTCESLLIGIAPPLMIDTMIDDPFGPGWKKFDDELRLRLWRSYAKFEEHVAEMGLAVSELKGKLNIGEGGLVGIIRTGAPKLCTNLAVSQPKLTDRLSIVRELRQGTVFTLKRKDYESILSRIKDGNSLLQDLVRQNCELEPSRRHRSQVRLIRLVRRLSQSIFSALLSATTCKCVRSHDVGLELIPRNTILIPGDVDDQAAKNLNFNIIWGSHGDSIKVGTEPTDRKPAKTYLDTRWESLRIQLAEFEKEKQASSSPLTQVASPTPTTKVSKRVQWSPPISFRFTKQATISTTQTLVEVAKSLTVVPTTGAYIPSQVSNLCRLLHRGKSSAVDCYGYISDVKRKFGLYPQVQHPDPCTTFSLRELLEGKSPLSAPFGYQEKLKVALALSVSVMHLHNTPWLARTVSLDDVVFLQDHGTPLSQPYSLYQPFVTKNLTEEPATQTKQLSRPPLHTLRPINLTILSLSALLIQVIIGRVVDGLEMTGNLDISAILSKTEAAGHFASHTRQDGGPNYEAAVKWCLKSVLEVAGFEDDNFCQDFYGGVVALLEKDAKLLGLID